MPCDAWAVFVHTHCCEGAAQAVNEGQSDGLVSAMFSKGELMVIVMVMVIWCGDMVMLMLMLMLMLMVAWWFQSKHIYWNPSTPIAPTSAFDIDAEPTKSRWQWWCGLLGEGCTHQQIHSL